ncbi:MAG: hypothetical protein ABS79_00340 [Planctomycetes bacterium SCN 63-9]|nr:MAG: hypothetical protein ABS79_00340 [Planctomycetes bacterium SCN 63-9]
MAVAGYFVSLALLGQVFAHRLMAEPPSVAARIHILKPDKNGATIKVRPGDEIILKLPMQIPFKWGLSEKAENLKEIRKPLQVIPIDGGDQPTEPPKAGGPQTVDLRYQILSMPKGEQKLQWLYCLGGRTSPNGQPIEPTEPLKADELPTKRGTYFRIVLTPEK